MSRHRAGAAAAPERAIGLRLTITLGLLNAMAPLATDLQLPALPELAASLHTSNTWPPRPCRCSSAHSPLGSSSSVG